MMARTNAKDVDHEPDGPARLTDTADTIGAALGNLAARLDAWKQQRHELTAEVERVVAAARAILEELSPAGDRGAAQRRGGRRKGYRMSDETREKLREAWRRRKQAADHDRLVTEHQAGAMEVQAKAESSRRVRWARRKNG
jgi:hypothetical protein